MIKEYQLRRIKLLLANSKRMPFILNQESESEFILGYRKMILNVKNQHELAEFLNIESQQFITTLYSHWLKITKSSNLYYVEVDKKIEDVYEQEVGEDENFLVIFFKEPDTKYGKTEECLSEINSEDMKDFLGWLSQEVKSVKSMRELKEKYAPVTQMLNEIKDEPNEELSDKFYNSLELMKKSIKQAITEDINNSTNSVIDEAETMKNINEILNDEEIYPFSKEEVNIDSNLKFKWLGNECELSFPLDITGNLNDNINLISYLDNKEGWLSQQERSLQETIIALWAEYIYSSEAYLNEDSEKVGHNWDTFSEYLMEWLRYDCNTEIKKIERKISETLSKIQDSGVISQFQFVTSNSSFIKVLLYIENHASEVCNKKIVINYKNIQKQYYYNLENEQTLGQIWGAITHDKIKKSHAAMTTTKQFEDLKKRFPNFKDVIEYYSGAMYIYDQTGTTPAPVLLLGSPGLGKTHFASEISKIIGSQMTVIPISSLTAGWIISGAAAQWKDAQMGKVATSLLNGSTMSPVIVLDEIDKKSDGNYNPVGALYPLLEYQTAKEFVDEFLEFPIDASNILWVATANSLNSIDEPILDRFVVFEIKKLTEEETKEVAKTIYNELTQGVFSNVLEDEILNLLKDKTPRQIKQILKKGLAYAAVARDKNVHLKKEHLDLVTKIRKIGF